MWHIVLGCTLYFLLMILTVPSLHVNRFGYWLVFCTTLLFVVYSVLQITIFQLTSIIRQRPKPVRHTKCILEINLESMEAVEWGWGVAPENLVLIPWLKQYKKTSGNSRVILYLFQIYASSNLKRILLKALKYRT